MTRLSDLLDRRVVTESGDGLGRAFDVRAVRAGADLTVVGLVVGRGGFLERLGIGAARAEAPGRHKRWTHHTVPWDAVVRLERKRIVVREGTRPS